MGTECHRIQTETLRVDTDSEALAMALQARLASLNRTVFFDVIERVFDEYAATGQHLRIASLSLDLGTLHLTTDFEDVASSRLERELRNALESVVREIVRQPSSEQFVQSAEEARLDLLDQYLSTGTLPFWAAASDFDLDAVMAEALASAPDGVVRLLRRRRDDAAVLRRLVHQLSEPVLRLLVQVLDADRAEPLVVEPAAVPGRSPLEARLGPADRESRVAAWVRNLTDTLAEWKVPSEESSVRLYNQADALEYYLRHSVLPWSAALAGTAGTEPALRLGVLLDSLPGWPRRLLRTIFPASPAERFQAALRAIQSMSEDAIARLLAAASIDGRGATAVGDLSAGEHLAERQAAFARAIVRMLDEGSGGLREVVGTSTSAGSDHAWRQDAGWIKSVLADRARPGGLGGATGPSSAILLQVLMDAHPADARHFFRVLHTAGRRPSALLSEPASVRLFESSLTTLPDRARAGLILLRRLVASLPARERPGDEDAARSRATAVVLDHAGEDGPRAPLLADMLRALFGSTISEVTARHLAAEADRLARAGQCTEQDVADVRGALGAVGRPEALDAEQPPEPDRIAAVLVERARTGHRPPEEPSSASLLRTLVERFPREARALLRRLREVGVRPSMMLTEPAAAHVFESALALLSPPDARSLQLLRRILPALPLQDRPGGDEATRSTLLGVMVDHAGEEARPGAVAAVALGRLFGPTLAAPVRQRLIAEAERLARAGEFTPGEVQAVLGPLGSTARRSPPHTVSGPTAGGARSTVEVPVFDAFRAPDEAAAALARLRVPGAAQPSAPAARLSDDALRHVLLELVDTAPDRVREIVRRAAADAAVRERWVRVLAEPELARITYLLDPRRHRALTDAAESLVAAWDDVGHRRASASDLRTTLWSFLLGFLSTVAEGERSLVSLVEEFFTYIGLEHVGDSGGPADRRDLAGRLLRTAIDLAERSGRAPLRAALSDSGAELVTRFEAPPTSPPIGGAEGHGRPPEPGAESGAGASAARRRAEPETPPRPARRRMAFGMIDDQPEPGGEPIHVANAGLVIVGAYLPQLFERLDVLEAVQEAKRRVRPDAVSRTVHLLQYLVDGRTDTPEPLLSLNKVLCGVPLAAPIERRIEMTPPERELCDSLLTAVIGNWTIIGNTSTAGLRETFLQREGRLDHPPTGWRLHVQRKTVDVLLDQIPWTIFTVAHDWMPVPLFVTW